MKLRITDLNDAGIAVIGQLPAAGLNERLNSESDSGILFTEAVAVTMHARRTAGGAELAGKLTGSYTQNCGRCLDPVPRSFSLPATFLIKSTPRGEGVPDDVGVLYYSGEHVELEGPLQETVILSLSVFWSPELTAGDKCSFCKKASFALKSEEEAAPIKSTRLGDLLKNIQ